MLKKQNEYLVYIIHDKKNVVQINISNDEDSVFKDQSKRNLKLVYFERFSLRNQALRKRNYLLKLDEERRMKLIKKKNPEMLNLIFTVFEK